MCNTCVGATKEELTKLRICTQHFPEDMIMPYASTRRLKENALPTLHINITDNSVINNHDVSTMALENVEDSSSLVEIIEESQEELHKENKKEEAKSKTTKKVNRLRLKITRLRKKLHKQKSTAHRRILKKCSKKNVWNDVTKDLTGARRNFMEMIATNFNCLPQVFSFKRKITYFPFLR